MFSIIKNAINVENLNLNKEQKTETKSASLSLTYDVEVIQILDKDNIPKLNPRAFNFEQNQEILDKILLTLDSIYPKLCLNKIGLKNTGAIPIAYENFYNNDKLGFENNRSIVAIWVNSTTTKKYIGANLDINKDFVNIEFDTVEPNDLIELNIVSYGTMEFVELKGKTKDFDKPHKFNDHYESLMLDAYKSIKFNVLPAVISAILFLFSGILITFGKYLEYKNMELHIRNPFVIQEVQKNVK